MWNLFRQPALQKERRDPVSQQPLPFIPTAGWLRPRLPPTWLGALGWRKTHRNEETKAGGNVLIPVPHLPSSIHPRHMPGAGALRLHHQTSLVPACTTEQPLTPSLPGTAWSCQKNGIRIASSSPSPGRLGWDRLRSSAVGYPAPNSEGCWFFGEGGGDLEACPFKCCWRLFLGHWLKIKIRNLFFFIRKSVLRFSRLATFHIPTAP